MGGTGNLGGGGAGRAQRHARPVGDNDRLFARDEEVDVVRDGEGRDIGDLNDDEDVTAVEVR